MATVLFGQRAIKIKPGCFLRPYKDNHHILVETTKLIKDWCVSPLPMTKNERKFIIKGYLFPVTGNKIPITGNKFSDKGNKFPMAGNKFPVTGNKFPVAGNLFPVTGIKKTPCAIIHFSCE